MEKLIVKNFKAIEYAEIEVNDLTFFIGQQASGKSTLAKLVYFFKTLGKYLTDEMLSSNFGREDLFLDTTNFCYAQFYSFFSESSVLEQKDFFIRYEYKEDIFFEIKATSSGCWMEGIPISELLKRSIKEYNELVSEHIFASEQEINLLTNQITKEIKTFIPYSSNNVYFPAGRSFFALVNKQSIELGKEFKDNYRDYLKNYKIYIGFDTHNENDLINYTFINFCTYLKKIVLSISQNENLISSKQNDIINGKYIQFGDEEFIEISENIKIHLSNSSSGQQESIRLIQDINYLSISKKEAFRVYEEPEAHLFPASQKALMEMIVILLNSNTNVQLLISTHTPYLLAVLNVLMKAKELEKQLGENDLTLDALVPKEERLDVSRVRVYSAKQTENGRFIFENVVNPNTQSINAEIIDEVSEKIEITYDQLLDLQSNLSNSVSE
ncbi:AAA family ATPase [Bernardetia sp. Wsw4-3y2]|uniref:AAA family ATPase n=1 Tax=Bernardetia sp. Wsw4-3y2 TaxID=3127471 RepID=UPI0030CF5AF9